MGSFGQELRITRNQAANVVVTMEDGDNITGWSIRFVIRKNKNSSIIISKTVGGGITLTTPLSGIFTVAFTAADTALLEDSRYLFQTWRTDSGSENPLNSGTLFVDDDLRED